MKVAIMQPYLFPYIGYFQLIMSSDIFVIYDDVNYIKKGFINRNSILLDGTPYRFTISVPSASQNKQINELQYSQEVGKLLKTIESAYIKAPFFKQVFPIIEDVLNYQSRSIAELCKFSYQEIFDYLGLEKKIILSSILDYDRTQSASKKLVDVTKKLNGQVYINSPGGRTLYDKTMFEPFGVKLKFIEPIVKPYIQLNTENFISYLSIIDILMNNDKKTVVEYMSDFSLVD